MCILLALSVSAQRKWKFKPVVIFNIDCYLKGKIDCKYPITMYLKPSGKSCGENSESYWNSQEITGWYYYDKKKKKIPLIGSIDLNNEIMHVFVPDNFLDTLHSKTCDLKNFNEEFRWNGDIMNWTKKGMDTSLIVTFKEKINPFSHQTKARILFLIDGVEMASFNITKLTNLNYIESIHIKSSKKIGNYFYMIFQIEEPARPGSNPMGRCGACYEGYLGFIKMKSNFELIQFDYKHIWSEVIKIDKCYCYDEKHPEKGLLLDNERKCCGLK